MLEGSYRRIYLVIYRVPGLAGLTPEVLNLLFKVIYINRMFPLSFCRGIPSLIKLGNYPRVAHTLEIWGFFFHSFSSKTHNQTWLGGAKGQKGKTRRIPGWRAQSKGLLLNFRMFANLLTDIFKFVVHVLKCPCMLSPGVFQRSTKLSLVYSKRKPSGRFNAED